MVIINGKASQSIETIPPRADDPRWGKECQFMCDQLSVTQRPHRVSIELTRLQGIWAVQRIAEGEAFTAIKFQTGTGCIVGYVRTSEMELFTAVEESGTWTDPEWDDPDNNTY